MKFNKVGQVFLLSAVALILATAFTACNQVTIDYLYVAGTQASPGQIEVFEVDRVTGALSTAGSTLAGSIFSSGGVTPVSMAPAPNGKSLYVANQGDSTLVHFTIGSGGLPSSPATVNLSSEGNTPVAITINTAGTLLYVLNQFQPGCSTATTGASKCSGGALAVFPIDSSGAVGSPVANGKLTYWPVGINPTAVNTLASGANVFVSTYDPSAGNGYIYSFGSTSGGVLSTVSGSPYFAGVKPAGITSEPENRFVYVTDFSQNELIAYSVISGGILRPLVNGPFKTGNEPSAIVLDPRGRFLYLTNELDNTVSAYNIDLPTGTPSAAVNVTGTATNNTGTLPVALLVDSGFGRYVFTANFIDNSVTGFQLNSSTGTLSPAQGGPFPSVGKPTALASIPRGNHSIQTIQP